MWTLEGQDGHCTIGARRYNAMNSKSYALLVGYCCQKARGRALLHMLSMLLMGN